MLEQRAEHTTGRDDPGGPVTAAIRIPPELELAAASRLTAESTAEARQEAGRRLVAAAGQHGIDLTLLWGTVASDGEGCAARVRQVCLAVPGAGKTAMLVLSGPHADDRGMFGDPAVQRAERAASIARALRGLADLNRERGESIVVAQALPDPGELWAVLAFLDAGFTRVADLQYLKRPLPGPPLPSGAAHPVWPEGVTVRTVRGVGEGEPDRELLIEALERSYEDTLDCPGLCGVRRAGDVLDSHRATGRWDGRRWRLVFAEGRPQGCLLLSHCPEQGSVELVYLGLSKALRGRGMGRALLGQGLARLGPIDADHVACAVDMRNTPALRVYERLGFAPFASRVALVKPV